MELFKSMEYICTLAWQGLWNSLAIQSSMEQLIELTSWVYVEFMEKPKLYTVQIIEQAKLGRVHEWNRLDRLYERPKPGRIIVLPNKAELRKLTYISPKLGHSSWRFLKRQNFWGFNYVHSHCTYRVYGSSQLHGRSLWDAPLFTTLIQAMYVCFINSRPIHTTRGKRGDMGGNLNGLWRGVRVRGRGMNRGKGRRNARGEGTWRTRKK